MTEEEKTKYEQLVFDVKLRAPLELFFFKSGINPNFAGFSPLIDALLLYAAYDFVGVTYVYDVIGELRGEEPTTIAKSMRFILNSRAHIRRFLDSLTVVERPRKKRQPARVLPGKTLSKISRKLVELGLIPESVAKNKFRVKKPKTDIEKADE